MLHDTQLVGGQPDSLTSVPVFSILGKEVKMHGAWEFPGGPRVGTEGFHCWGPGSLPGQGTEVLQATRHSQKKSAVPERPLSPGSWQALAVDGIGIQPTPPNSFTATGPPQLYHFLFTIRTRDPDREPQGRNLASGLWASCAGGWGGRGWGSVRDSR